MTSMNRQKGVFVFEADTAAFANRKRAARACTACQKRKKRCPHTFTKPLDGQNTGGGGDGAEKVLPNLIHKEPIRFVGDLNPESILSDLSNGTKEKRFARIATWVPQSKLDQQEQLRREEEAAAAAATQTVAAEEGVSHASAAEALGAKQAESKALAVERYSKIERGRRTLTGHQRNYLQAVGAFRVLPKDTSDALIGLYIAHIDPILPIIDGNKFHQEYLAGEASIWLIQAVCLVACKTVDAFPHLKLYEDGPLLDPIHFARSLHTGLDAAVKADLEADRFKKVQILTLMSLHNDGPGGIEESSAHLIQAIHDAQTTGVHIHTPGRTRNDQGAMLWWTLWALDKFNACLGGRPLMIADRDIDIDKPSLENNARSRVMAAWLVIGEQLDKVIEYYRPGADPEVTGWEHDFTTFSALTSECELDKVEPAHRNLLEICYNIIGILACRNGGPTTTSYIRRISCSDRIQSLVSGTDHKNLPPIPLLPYAVSLSLTVAYRGLRDHYSDPAKALADLTTRCEILEGLSKTWWTADAMTKLGRKALKSLQNPAQPLKPVAEAGDFDAMQAEVTPCKFGPFHGSQAKEVSSTKSKGAPSTKNTSAPGTKPQVLRRANSDSQERGLGNALQVLSDAAATHGLPTSAVHRFPYLHLGGGGESEPDRKRRRFGVSPHPFPTMGVQGSFGAFPSTLAHTNIGGSTTSSQTTPSFHDPSSTSATTPATTLMTEPTSDHLGPDTFPAAFSQSIDYSDPTAFNDLDNLFDGFFDLSMPTMFQDPLFEGAAYLGVDDFSMMDPASFDYQSQGMLVPGVMPNDMGIGPGAFGVIGVNGNVHVNMNGQQEPMQ